MPHWKTLIPSERPFLGWWDLIDQGDVNVVIEHVGIEPVWDNRLKKERDKIVLKLKGTKKKFVPNVTNIKTLISTLVATGLTEHDASTTERWIGAKITLFPTTCRGEKGKVENCLRIRAADYKAPRKGGAT